LSYIPEIEKNSPACPCEIRSKFYGACPVDILQSTGVKSQKELFHGALGKTTKKEFLPGMIYLTGLPGELPLTGLPMQPGDVPRTEADVTDLVDNLGYKPNTPVGTGIERFIKWYKQYFSQL
jgi:nucleoside-diphosphate-sugar epimerase